jgi:hypothetical protein
MPRLLNRLGDRLLGAVLPRGTASACALNPAVGHCQLVYQECYTGATCTAWWQCRDSQGLFCHVDAPGSYDYNYVGCC